MATAKAPDNDAPEGFLAKFTCLFTAPRELWIIYFLKVAEIAAYGLVSQGLMLYLITDLHYRDVSAGSFIAAWSIILSAFTFLAGSLTDAIGIRKAFIYGFVICLITRTILGLFSHPILVPLFGLLPMAVGLALLVPVMVAAIRRYTNTKQRSIAFSLFYVFMNVGFIVAGKLFDWIRTWMGKDGTFDLGFLQLSVYQTIFLVSVVFTIIGLIPLLLWLRPGVEMDEEEDTYTVDPSREAPQEGGVIESFGKVARKTGGILVEVFREGAFYRFLLLLGLIVCVRMVFYHMHYTLPPYLDRELGFGSRFGTAWGVLNPVIIVVLVPIIGALAQNISSYKMLVVGTFLSALPTFLLALPQDTFAGLVDTWFGEAIRVFLEIDGDLAPLYVNLILFVLVFSVGEAIWSPRLYEYTASVAPKGREATYMSLSLLPYFFAKFAVGPLAGVLLGAYCPAEGARQSTTIWLLIASMALAGPVLILLLRSVIRPKSREDEALKAEGDEEAGTDEGAAEEEPEVAS